MERALGETARRRERQLAFNAEHGITPKSIEKNIADIMADAHHTPGRKKSTRGDRRKIAEAGAAYEDGALSPSEAATRIAGLEKEMFQAAENLEFEQAAQIRDRIQQIRKLGLAS